MNYLAVARAGTGTRPRLAFEHAHAAPPPGKRSRRGEADDTCAANRCIDCFHYFVVRPSQVRPGRAVRTPPRKRARRDPALSRPEVRGRISLLGVLFQFRRAIK